MSRSKWKGPYVDSSIEKKIFSQTAKSFPFKIWSRASTICPKFVGLRFRVHNGKDFFPLVVTESMIGHKLGEFVLTRARYEFKKKKKKKK